MFLSHHQNNSEIHICKCGSRTEKKTNIKMIFVFCFFITSDPLSSLDIVKKQKQKKSRKKVNSIDVCWCGRQKKIKNHELENSISRSKSCFDSVAIARKRKKKKETLLTFLFVRDKLMNDPNNNNNKITCQQNRENLSLNFVNQQNFSFLFDSHFLDTLFLVGIKSKVRFIIYQLQMENSIQWKKERMRGYIFIWIGKRKKTLRISGWFFVFVCFCRWQSQQRSEWNCVILLSIFIIIITTINIIKITNKLFWH